ncbi:MAG: transcriptional regulator [Pirellulales bacterium]|nr:transcriptional regulator [Pirellulales bacterium]
MARNEQLIRQLKLLQILEESRYGCTLEELRAGLLERLGLSSLSTRTVRRDLEALQAAGFDVDTTTSEARGTVWKLGRTLRRLPELSATCTELLALSAGRDLLLALSGTPFAQGIESFWEKIREALPEPVWKHFERRRQKLIVRTIPHKSYATKAGILATLNRAILEHRRVEIAYQGLGKPRPMPRKIEPLGLAVYQGSIYAVASACDAAPDEPPRHFKLDRISRSQLLDERFAPRAFDLQSHFSHSVGVYKAARPQRFRIRFSALVAPWASETPWHPQAKLEPLDDGGLMMTLTAAYEAEIVPKVLGLGAEVEILEPASARRAVEQIARRMVAVYGEATAPMSCDGERIAAAPAN